MRPRKHNDGLPHRVYERRGLKVYSIGYTNKANRWVFRLQCDIKDAGRIKQLRREAILKATNLTTDDGEISTINQLFAAFFDHHEKLMAQPRARGARKASTLAENRREAATLCTAFGEMAVIDVRYHHAATYQDRCDELGRGAKSDKEITLLSKALNFARRRGIIDINPLTDIERLPSRPSERYVMHSELDLTLGVGRRMGGAPHIIALGLKTAYLCMRRSVEVRDLQTTGICDEGIWWTEGKTRAGVTPKKILIEWSPELKALIDEARSIRPLTALGPYIFGTLEGEKYTKGGWKPGLKRLMDECEKEAAATKTPFKRFSLMDLRPKAVTDQLDAGEPLQDVVDAALHNSPRMVTKHYDRRRLRRAKPVAQRAEPSDDE
jgi:hypothetical protein